MLETFSYTAVTLMIASYWFQIYKIHVHKEVRDLSLIYYVLLAIGFSILSFTAYIEGSNIFLTKQIGTLIPVLIIISQIVYHKKDTWHDENCTTCSNCNFNLESHWNYCPNCRQAVEETPDESSTQN